jgi:hypothetical protein
MSEPRYSPELIRRYRELQDSDGFQRKIAWRRPVTLEADLIHLECGHERKLDRNLIDLLKMNGRTGLLKCEACVEEWLKKAQEEA